MSDVLDSVMTYRDGKHIDSFHIGRVETNQMTENEEKTFWYHLSECRECREEFSKWLNNRKPASPVST